MAAERGLAEAAGLSHYVWLLVAQGDLRQQLSGQLCLTGFRMFPAGLKSNVPFSRAKWVHGDPSRSSPSCERMGQESAHAQERGGPRGGKRRADPHRAERGPGTSVHEHRERETSPSPAQCVLPVLVGARATP